jgi:hypothetical protein
MWMWLSRNILSSIGGPNESGSDATPYAQFTYARFETYVGKSIIPMLWDFGG